MRRHKKTASASRLEYTVRQTRRVIFVVLGIFVLFVVVMAIVWAVPKIWHWAVG